VKQFNTTHQDPALSDLELAELVFDKSKNSLGNYGFVTQKLIVLLK